MAGTKSKKPKSSAKDGSSNGANHNELMVVGIGASAGGVAALGRFFDSMPDSSGMAFAVILHLSDHHESQLAEILQTHTQMPVRQVVGTLKVEPNCIYVIPPTHNIEVSDGVIRLSQPVHVMGKRVPVDIFFRSLADTYGRNAVAVVLSGTGSDGTLGLKRVKENGGIVLAQAPSEAEYDGMPTSAIETGLVDVVLPVEAMPERLLKFKETVSKLDLPPHDDDLPIEQSEDTLREALATLRLRTGHDFSNYKPATILRRVTRRLQVHGLTDMTEYAVLLRESRDEASALQNDLLITVTNFFRDGEAFEALEKKIFPEIFHGKTEADSLRIWCTACATGEEAYSLAILAHEQAARMPLPPKIQIFATDINTRAIAFAREGLYDEAIMADVSAERLRRFFTKEGTRYRIKKHIRESVLFAPHNVLRDPPFSRLDLLTCRNLMIYLNRETQAKVLGIFHFALLPDGHLFLGSSESAETSANIFIPVDKKHRLYKSRLSSSVVRTMPSLPLRARWDITPQPKQVLPSDSPVSYGDIHYKLVEYFAPPSVLVNDDYDVVHVSENAGRFLRFGGGEPTRNLLKIVHPGLKLDLQSALLECRQGSTIGESRQVAFKVGDEERTVSIKVNRIETPQSPESFFLVTFSEAKDALPPPSKRAKIHPGTNREALNTIVKSLEDELTSTKDRLRSTVEQHETSIEELKASNEELQAINEELRSATEELETSKEELQSSNEELTTVNFELKDRVDELSRANGDLKNLMTSTSVGTIFLDRALHIRQYTPPVEDIFNVIPSDVGRPFEHLTHNLIDVNLADDAVKVLTTLKTIERALETTDGKHYLSRILPYLTMDNRVDGVVVNFIDITERKRAEQRLQKAFQVETVGVLFFKTTGEIYDANDTFLRMSGYSRDDLRTGIVRWDTLTPPEWMARSFQAVAEFKEKGYTTTYEKEYIRPDGSRWWGLFTATRLSETEGVEYVLDVTERKRTDMALRDSEELRRLIVDSIHDHAIFSTDTEGRITTWNAGAENVFGFKEKNIIGQYNAITFTPEDRANGIPELEMANAREKGSAVDERWHLRGDGTRFYASGMTTPIRDGDVIVGYVKVARDLTERQQLQETLKETSQRKDEFLATLAHELRNPLAAIRSGMEVMRRRDSKEKGLKARDIIMRQLDQVVRLVDDLMDVSRITQGKIKLRKERLRLDEIISRSLETVAPLVESAGHEITVVLPDEQIYLDADATRLTQVFFNLLSNAVKFTENGGQIKIAAERDGDVASIKISDNGIGIPPEMLPTIFGMFTQVEHARKTGQSGLGIGLGLVQRLVDLHGGSVAATSAGEGEGSQFTVRLPIAANQEAERNSKRKKPKLPDGALRVLVVDDNADAAEMLEVLLTLENHEVKLAFDGAAGVNAAEEFDPHAILLDIGLPDMSGHDVARKIRENNRDVLLIALTGWGQEEDQHRSRAAGFDYHLVKPVQIEEVEKLLTARAKR
jgi:two-component system, chemotaxis family, CheB/CheR fusion protein